MHVFRYSTRKGTAGASLPDAVPGEVKIERSDRLEETAGEVARRFRTANTGIVHTVLAEEIQDGYMTGYTGNYIKGILGKNGRIYDRHDAFCLETQCFPDTPNQKDFPTCILEPGQKMKAKTVYSFTC